MAAARSEKTYSNKTVLRLKRKRSEDPADLLLVSHAFKKSFKEADLAQNNESNSVQRIFRLAGTVSESDHALSPDVLNSYLKRDNNEHKSKVKNTPKSGVTVELINEKLRETKQLSSQRSRYKVVLKNRRNEEQTSKQEENGNDDSTKEEISTFFKMYDAIMDDVEITKKSKEQKSKEDIDSNAILCNSVKMIREKLNLHDESESNNPVICEKGYVYDVYCAEDNLGDLEEVLDIVRLNECQLVSEIDNEFENYDDEDDSNDENNWRNDYPDGDEWSESSNDEPRYKSEHFDYGWKLDKYDRGYDERMFHYGDLSSDEENDSSAKKFNEYGNDNERYSFEVVDNDDD